MPTHSKTQLNAVMADTCERQLVQVDNILSFQRVNARYDVIRTLYKTSLCVWWQDSFATDQVGDDKNEPTGVRTCDLVTVGRARNVLLLRHILETDRADELFDFVETQFAVVVEEHLAVVNGQVRVLGDMPHLLQVLVVQHK